MKIINIVGARPNFMKIAPLMKEYKNHPEIEAMIVHTGQHYDKNMSDDFFRVLNIPDPKYNLGVGAGSATEQTAKIMIEFEKICLAEKPDWVVVVGDVNSTIACALVAKRLGIKVAHVEAGLRSFDRSMPEEINRILTDSISDLLFVTEESGVGNLKKEGQDESKIFFVGNVMIDSFIMMKDDILKKEAYKEFEILPGEYAVMTFHRPSNVDNPENLSKLLNIIDYVQKKIKVVIPIHPRTNANLEKLGLKSRFSEMKNVIVSPPLDYTRFLNLVYYSKFIMTDSGGIQEESAFIKKPCITLRENTERPSTLLSTNVLTGLDFDKILTEIENIFSGNFKKGADIPSWDGKASQRIVKVLKEKQ